MYIPYEKDTLQKLALISFAQAMLAFIGDSRKVIGFYPTELIIPTFRNKFMDGVVELEDGTLLNIEFQTGNLAEKFLLRCAQYAVNLRVISGKLVETLIFSTGIRKKSRKLAFISKFFSFEPKLFFYSEFDGLEKLINIKNKIENNEKLTLLDCYNLVFIPLMGNVDKVKVAFEVFDIANHDGLFSEDIRLEIKKCQFVVAHIIAGKDSVLYNKFLKVIKMNNRLWAEYEKGLIDKNTEEVTKSVTESVTRRIARNLKGALPDSEIAKRTGLSIDEVKGLEN